MFGRDPKFPVDELFQVNKRRGETPEMQEFRKHLVKTIEEAGKQAKNEMDKRMEIAKRMADKIRRKNDLVEGELVLYRDYTLRVGMSEKYKNPWGKVYRVRRIEGQHAYIVPK